MVGKNTSPNNGEESTQTIFLRLLDAVLVWRNDERVPSLNLAGKEAAELRSFVLKLVKDFRWGRGAVPKIINKNIDNIALARSEHYVQKYRDATYASEYAWFFRFTQERAYISVLIHDFIFSQKNPRRRIGRVQ